MFRRKVLIVFALTVFLSVAAVAWLVSEVTRRAFVHSEDERTAALVTQFRREFNRQGEDVARQVETIATSEAASRMALALNRTPADSGPYFELAKTVADSRQLNFLEFVESDGTIVSSAQWPAKFGYIEIAMKTLSAAAGQGAFLKQEDLQDGTALGLFAVRTTRAGERPVYVIGGRQLDKDFLSALDLPIGMRALLYQNRGEHFSADLLIDPSTSSSDKLNSPEKLEPLIDAVRRYGQEMTGNVKWSEDRAEDEVFHAIPLLGAGTGKDRPLLGILLIGNSRRTYVELMRRIVREEPASDPPMIKARRLFESFTFVIWRIVPGESKVTRLRGRGHWPTVRLLEVTMYESDCHGTFSDSRRNALDGPMADVTSRKRAGHGRFKIVRQTLHRPARDAVLFLGAVSGQRESRSCQSRY